MMCPKDTTSPRGRIFVKKSMFSWQILKSGETANQKTAKFVKRNLAKLGAANQKIAKFQDRLARGETANPWKETQETAKFQENMVNMKRAPLFLQSYSAYSNMSWDHPPF